MDFTALQFRPDLLALGVTDGELRRSRRRGDLHSVRRGAYTDANELDAVARHRLAVTAAVRFLSPDAVVCGVSAAVMHGIELWRMPLQRVHVLRTRRSGARRGRVVEVHTAPLDDDERTLVGAVATTTVARTLVDIARRYPFEQAVVALDHALHRHLLTHAELGAALDRAAGWRGVPRARRAIEFADPGGASVGESRSRVAIARCHLAAPALQYPVLDSGGHVIAWCDFGWEKYGVVGEFDGMVKYGRELRAGRSPADVVVAEKLREDRVRDENLRVGRWTWSDIGEFGRVAARLEHFGVPRRLG